MALEIKLNDRLASVELVRRNDNHVQIKVDGKMYELDMVKVNDGVYSLLLDGQSYRFEILEKEGTKAYNVSRYDKSYYLEIIDAESRYLLSRTGNVEEDGDNTISSPMPGKIVSIPVKAGQKVKNGQTVIIVSAMKMESEYKAGKNGRVKAVLVQEGDTIEGNQPLITLE